MAKDRNKVDPIKVFQRYEARKKLNNAYNKEHYKAITIRFDYVKDADIINWLQNIGSNVDYIRTLIRRDMNQYEET